VPLSSSLNVSHLTSSEDDTNYPNVEHAQDAFTCLLRGKGFVWLAHSSNSAFFWSHAGAHFEMQLVGRWWATVPQNQWPQWQVTTINDDFVGDNGDRRQEIVLIGIGVDVARQRSITAALDWALLSDDEFTDYQEYVAFPARLASLFQNSLPIRVAVV
jgi:G3E family GTPase